MHLLHVHSVSPDRVEWEATVECPEGGDTDLGGHRLNHVEQADCSVVFEDDDGAYLGYCSFHYVEDEEGFEGLFPPCDPEEAQMWPKEWPTEPGTYPVSLHEVHDGDEWTAWIVLD